MSKSSKDYYNELESGIIILKDLIDKYKKIKTKNNFEIEIRIGRIHDTSFIPGLNNENFFNKILSNFNSSKCWDKIEIQNTKELINKQGKIIKNIDDTGKEINDKIKFLKKNLKEKTDLIYENSPYDLRISVSEELFQKFTGQSFNAELIREKYRTKFYYKNEFVIDITKVVEIKNTVSKEKYEVEVELLNLESSMSSIYKAHSALLLIRDIINFCEKLDDFAELLVLEISEMSIN